MVVHFHFLVVPAQVLIGAQDGYFAILLEKYCINLNATVLFVFYQAIVLLQAIRINLLFNEQKMFPQSGYTPAMTYILLTGILPEWSAITPALLANFLLIWIYVKSIRLFTNASPKALLFNIGLLVGVAIFCYHPIVVMIIVVQFALAIMRPFKLQEWIILLMGICLPYYFLAAVLFLSNHFSQLLYFIPSFRFSIPVNNNNPLRITGIIVQLFAFFAGVFCWKKFNSRLVIQIRKNWLVLLIMVVALFIAPFIANKTGLNAAILCLIPFSAFISNVFSFPKRLLFPNLLFWMLATLIVYNNWQMIKF